jgi:serine/threonine protein kinase
MRCRLHSSDQVRLHRWASPFPPPLPSYWDDNLFFLALLQGKTICHPRKLSPPFRHNCELSKNFNPTASSHTCLMEDDSDSYQSSEWEDGEIKSRSIWRQANIFRPIGGPDADTSHLALCQRRGKGDSQFDPKLYIRKLLTKKPVHGTKYIKRELEMLRSCDHRNILRFEDFSYSPRSWKEPFAKLYTEYCAKGDLEQFTVSGKRPNWQLSNGKGFQVFSQIAQALLYIHHGIELTWEGLPCMARIHTDQSSRGNLRNGEWETILHRDIKPGNSESQNSFVSRHDADRRCSFH